MSRAAEDTVHVKTLLAEDIATKMFRDLMAAWMESESKTPWAGSAMFKHDDDPEAECDYMAQVVAQSENFYVAPPMMRLANEIAPEMPDEELYPYDLPSNSGFMWFGEPYRQIDVRRKTLSINCMMWHATGHKVRLWHFTHKANSDDWVNQWFRFTYDEEMVQRILPTLSVNHVFEMEFGQRLPRGISWETALPWDAKVEWESNRNPDGTWEMRMVTDQPIEELARGEQPKMIRSTMAAFVVCLWRLCQQSIASRLVEEPARPARRRMLRAHIPVRPITVINLRRFDQTPAHPEASVEWQHHWVVRGHWRRQPYREKTEDGQKITIYREIYINPYLKGDLDKPLLHRDKVNALVR